MLNGRINRINRNQLPEDEDTFHENQQQAYKIDQIIMMNQMIFFQPDNFAPKLDQPKIESRKLRFQCKTF